MMQNQTIKNNKQQEIVKTPPAIDENMGVFIYGSLVIKDVESGKILVKKSF